jgi:hypothetical protein
MLTLPGKEFSPKGRGKLQENVNVTERASALRRDSGL